ncbi:MAG: serine/threonine protein kinase [Anaerolineae bacterium]|nr:serine/threonine protein kinase [Anaerolineae bacterium]
MQDILQPGTMLEGRYRLVSEAAVQDLASLYRGYDTVEDQLVMILILPFRVASGSEVLSKLSRTQRAVAALGEQALVPYEYGGLAEGRLYLVRRHVEGRSLADLLAGGPLDPATAADITIALSELVSLLHHAGMVHGSLCPHCVYVDTSGAAPAVSMTDCGLCPALREIQSSPGRPWGRPPYLSPEQAAGEEIHPASDVYVIGSLLYAMLTGRPPFRSADETVLVVQHLRQEPPALDVLLPDLPPALVQIVQKALAKEPAARYRNAGQLAEILRSRVRGQAGEDAWPRAPSPHRHLPAPGVGPVVFRPGETQASRLGQGIDWMMIILIIAALLAMFGLVRLWQTVYDLYTTPSAGLILRHGEFIHSTGATHPLKNCHCERSEAISSQQGGDCPSHPRLAACSFAMTGVFELPRRAKSWLITSLSGIIQAPRDTGAGEAARDRLPACGVKITGSTASLC